MQQQKEQVSTLHINCYELARNARKLHSISEQNFCPYMTFFSAVWMNVYIKKEDEGLRLVNSLSSPLAGARCSLVSNPCG